MRSVTLYGKPGCHLCAEAREAIESVRADDTAPSFDLREVDISSDPALHTEYGERIPVVELHGEVLFEYRVDPAALRRRLDTVAS